MMIDPGGLLLVVPTYMQFQLQFFWWGWPKKKLNLDILFYYPEYHTEHRWRCSNYPTTLAVSTLIILLSKMLKISKLINYLTNICQSCKVI
jgi:hypothetical protein